MLSYLIDQVGYFQILNSGGSRLALVTREVLKSPVLQHFSPGLYLYVSVFLDTSRTVDRSTPLVSTVIWVYGSRRFYLH